MKLGYACLNMSLPTKFRTCRLQTLETKGMAYIKELTLHNINELKRVLQWNIQHDIYFFRITSELIPFATHEKMTWDWTSDEDVLHIFNEIKALQTKHRLRLSVHPGQYTIINSPRRIVVDNARKDLDYHAKLLALVNGTDMIIHTGGLYGDKEQAIVRFEQEYHQLPQIIKSYLRLENDDKIFSTADVLAIHNRCGVPICFDIHHERCFGTQEKELKALFQKVNQTWKQLEITPKVHISSGKSSSIDRSHADFIHLDDFQMLQRVVERIDVDVMIEAKAKDQALTKLRQQL